MNYFAYGSNLSEKRMLERGVYFTKKTPSILKGYKFTVNKISFKDPRVGFANIIKDDNSSVEGAIYEINDNDISKLDKFEGYPKHYDRITMRINNVDAIVYIANPNWVSPNELLTTPEYKNLILEGKDCFSYEYYEMLSNIKTL